MRQRTMDVTRKKVIRQLDDRIGTLEHQPGFKTLEIPREA